MPKQLGVSLIEALLALVVMAVGMLGVVGLQATLRSNADLSRQLAEAVRMGQEKVEAWRRFMRVESGALVDFDGDVVEALGVSVTTFDGNAWRGNASYIRDALVDPARNDPAAPAWPNLKTLQVQVNWVDRRGEAQSVTMLSAVARVSPELAGSLAIPPQGVPTRQPLGRHSAIPPSAVPQADGSLRFDPPPTAENRPAWFFNATTGLITRICTDATDNSTCASAASQFLTGFVSYSVAEVQPFVENSLVRPTSTLGDLQAVVSSALGVQASVRFTTSENASAATANCFVGSISGDPNAATEYFCAIPLAPRVQGVVPTWSGRLFYYTDTNPDRDRVTTNAAESSNNKIRICRYFDVLGSGNYSGIDQPLSNQNYLVIRAGGAVPTVPPDPPATTPPVFACPAWPLPIPNPPPPPLTVPHPRS
jgi:hypothetical protein